MQNVINPILDKDGKVEGWYIPFKSIDEWLDLPDDKYQSLSGSFGQFSGIAFPNHLYWSYSNHDEFIENLRKFHKDLTLDVDTAPYYFYTLPYLQASYNEEDESFNIKVTGNWKVLPTISINHVPCLMEKRSSWFRSTTYGSSSYSCFVTCDEPSLIWYIHYICRKGGWLNSKLWSWFNN